MEGALLSIAGLSKRFGGRGRTVAALQDVSFTIAEGETLGLAGASGCGKSTLSRIVMRLIAPDEGTIRFMGEDWRAKSGGDLRDARRHMQMVFQDTHAAFNPRATVAETISDPLRIHKIVGKRAQRQEVENLLGRVGLNVDIADRPVLQLSGGQRQRVAIARALAPRPRLLVMDEAVSALDVSVRGQILRLLVSLQRETGLACLFVSHDLAVIKAVCHRVAIMDAGRIVELGDTPDVIAAPESEAAQRLVQAVPDLRRESETHAAP